METLEVVCKDSRLEVSELASAHIIHGALVLLYFTHWFVLGFLATGRFFACFCDHGLYFRNVS